MSRPLARWPWILAALLFLATAGLYWRATGFAFLNYDDDVYVLENAAVRAGLTLEGLRWALTSGYAANWHPLTWLAHMLDVELFGLDAGAHHRSSVLLHAASATLLFGALRALTGATWKSALVAAFFALHPLRAESVAWVSERKDVLAGALAFACLWAYAAYARTGGALRYLACLALFALGLLAKPMLVTLPCALLLLDVWPLGRLRTARYAPLPPPALPSLAPTHPGDVPGKTSSGGSGCRVWLEKLPFFTLALASAWITLRIQRAGGAVGPLDVIGVEARVANAFQSYATYVVKTSWPSGLCAFYPHPAIGVTDHEPWTGKVLGSLVLLAGASLLALRLRERVPAVLVGWLWFLGLLVPVVGFVQVGLQAWADRYSYLPSVGLLLAIVWGVEALAQRWNVGKALALTSLVVLGTLALASARQIETWRDSRSVFERALRVTQGNFLAHVNLGQALEEAGELDAAARHYAAALELRPNLAPVRVGLGRIARLQGRTSAAVEEYERALALDPSSIEAHAELGWLLSEIGRDAEALGHLRAAARLAPDDLPLRNNLAWVLATSRTQGAPEEALAIAEDLCRRTRNAQAGFLETLAAALARLERFEEAVDWQTRALSGVPAQARATLRERLELFQSSRPFLKTP